MKPDVLPDARIVAALERSGASHWFLHISHVDTIDLEMTKAGPACTYGESHRVNVALWWQERCAVASLPLPEATAGRRPGRLAGFIEKLERTAQRSPPATPPVLLPGHEADWPGDWGGLLGIWKRHLAALCRRHDGWQLRWELHLSRRRSLLCDAHGVCRSVRRHATRVDLTIAARHPAAAVWTMSVPLSSPDVGDLTATIEEAMTHARTRANGVSLPAGSAPVGLAPFAVAQILTAWQDAVAQGKTSIRRPGLRVGRPAGGLDDLGGTQGLWFGEEDALPRLVPLHRWVSHGTMDTWPGPRPGLYVRHLEEMLDDPATGRLRVLAVADRHAPRSGRRTGLARLDIPWGRFWQALQTDARKGPKLQAIGFGDAEYHVPALALGKLTWHR